MKQPPYILIVDDDRQVARMTNRVLEANGYESMVVSSGRAALRMIKERRPGLLILDLNMPEPDGFDILRIKRSQFPYLKILLISGYLHRALVNFPKFFGAVGTLQKPFEADELVSEVQRLLAH